MAALTGSPVLEDRDGLELSEQADGSAQARARGSAFAPLVLALESHPSSFAVKHPFETQPFTTSHFRSPPSSHVDIPAGDVPRVYGRLFGRSTSNANMLLTGVESPRTPSHAHPHFSSVKSNATAPELNRLQEEEEKASGSQSAIDSVQSPGTASPPEEVTGEEVAEPERASRALELEASPGSRRSEQKRSRRQSRIRTPTRHVWPVLVMLFTSLAVVFRSLRRCVSPHNFPEAVAGTRNFLADSDLPFLGSLTSGTPSFDHGNRARRLAASRDTGSPDGSGQTSDTHGEGGDTGTVDLACIVDSLLTTTEEGGAASGENNSQQPKQVTPQQLNRAIQKAEDTLRVLDLACEMIKDFEDDLPEGFPRRNAETWVRHAGDFVVQQLMALLAARADMDKKVVLSWAGATWDHSQGRGEPVTPALRMPPSYPWQGGATQGPDATGDSSASSASLRAGAAAAPEPMAGGSSQRRKTTPPGLSKLPYGTQQPLHSQVSAASLESTPRSLPTRISSQQTSFSPSWGTPGVPPPRPPLHSQEVSLPPEFQLPLGASNFLKAFSQHSGDTPQRLSLQGESDSQQPVTQPAAAGVSTHPQLWLGEPKAPEEASSWFNTLFKSPADWLSPDRSRSPAFADDGAGGADSRSRRHGAALISTGRGEEWKSPQGQAATTGLEEAPPKSASPPSAPVPPSYADAAKAVRTGAGTGSGPPMKPKRKGEQRVPYSAAAGRQGEQVVVGGAEGRRATRDRHPEQDPTAQHAQRVAARQGVPHEGARKDEKTASEQKRESKKGRSFVESTPHPGDSARPPVVKGDLGSLVVRSGGQKVGQSGEWKTVGLSKKDKAPKKKKQAKEGDKPSDSKGADSTSTKVDVGSAGVEAAESETPVAGPAGRADRHGTDEREAKEASKKQRKRKEAASPPSEPAHSGDGGALAAGQGDGDPPEKRRGDGGDDPSDGGEEQKEEEEEEKEEEEEEEKAEEEEEGEEERGRGKKDDDSDSGSAATSVPGADGLAEAKGAGGTDEKEQLDRSREEDKEHGPGSAEEGASAASPSRDLGARPKERAKPSSKPGKKQKQKGKDKGGTVDIRWNLQDFMDHPEIMSDLRQNKYYLEMSLATLDSTEEVFEEWLDRSQTVQAFLKERDLQGLREKQLPDLHGKLPRELDALLENILSVRATLTVARSYGLKAKVMLNAARVVESGPAEDVPDWGQEPVDPRAPPEIRLLQHICRMCYEVQVRAPPLEDKFMKLLELYYQLEFMYVCADKVGGAREKVLKLEDVPEPPPSIAEMATLLRGEAETPERGRPEGSETPESDDRTTAEVAEPATSPLVSEISQYHTRMMDMAIRTSAELVKYRTTMETVIEKGGKEQPQCKIAVRVIPAAGAQTWAVLDVLLYLQKMCGFEGLRPGTETSGRAYDAFAKMISTIQQSAKSLRRSYGVYAALNAVVQAEETEMKYVTEEEGQADKESRKSHRSRK
ncbi:hypothetical protein TGRUB_254960 [Toxoplasma gondii RUB]|uniref:Uncharacterized protein n=1 Tax=Toxoplasma gondii RUB TaxID=935652 RepID=A0A086LTC4_TOXGO|nr:hypothetical protein TGRUB_254960 [Toxoplasma gondii RUB]